MPNTPSYCPVSRLPMPATALPTGSTAQPLSRAADQIVAIPQLGPQTRGTVAASLDGISAPAAAGQSGSRSNRLPAGAAARRSRQNSDTMVTMVQPTCSAPADARLTTVSAQDRKPAAVRAVGGTPSDRHTDTRSEAIARNLSRTCFESGHRIATAGDAPSRGAGARDSRSNADRFRANDDSYTNCLSGFRTVGT
jgi:hypothetical protein